MSDQELETPLDDEPRSNSSVFECGGFIVATGHELMEAFGLTAENRPIIKLNPEEVPDELRALIPYAEEWGIADDLIRADVIDKASPEALRDLVATVDRYIDTIGEWLAGPEVYNQEHAEAYYIFSAMVYASDEARYSGRLA